MILFDSEKRAHNKKRHESFRAYYWKTQTNSIFRMSLCFLTFCVFCFFFVVPFEHAKYPDLGRLKYGIGIIGHILFAIFSKWLLTTNLISDDKKALVSERFTFILGLGYLIWGILGMEVAMNESSVPVILIYLILLAVITAFLYFPLHYYIWLVIISYSIATISFLSHKDILMDVTSAICAVIMMIVLGVLSNTRYRYGRDRFEFETQNAKLIEEKEGQNEELEAQNEELIAINQELNDTTEKLSKALEELGRASESQKMFTNSMNHELRTPLNGIIGTIHIMLMNDNLKASDRQYLQQCLVMSQTLLNIVNDLLDFAKMDAGEFKILPTAFDLHNVINNIDSIFRIQAANKGLELIFDIADDTICGLYGDDLRIQQILNNIISNSIKYTEKGSVIVKATYDNNNLKFVVSDTGQGMSEESLKYLFVPFKRIAEYKNRNIQGTGLGMSIVINLINQMNGTINVDSALEKGTTFTIVIPSKITNKDNTWSSSVSIDSLTDISSDTILNNKKILYVDDTKINLMILEKMLSDTGAQVTTTEYPLECIRLANESLYDAIIVDHQMPKMSGPEVINAIKKESTLNSDTPIIVFTGNTGSEFDEDYEKMGFSGYISKPVYKNALINVLKSVLY